MTVKTLKNRIKNLPKEPGVYIFSAKGGPASGGRKLYIGKASNLKSRVLYYLKTSDSRLQKMVSLTTSLAYRTIDSDIEALILESQLIKKYRPQFNIMLRDDKQYFYVSLTDEKFPHIYLTHQIQDRGLRGPVASSPHQYSVSLRADGVPSRDTPRLAVQSFIGPFTDGSALKTTLKYLRRIFPYCTCGQKHNNYCLNYHIGNCPGFCCLKNNNASKEQIKEYKKNIKAIKDILTGRKTTLIKKLEKEMKNYGKKQEFAKAIELREKMAKIKRVFENVKIINKLSDKQKEEYRGRIEGYDISNIQGTNAVGSMVVFNNGQPDKNEYRKFKIRTKKTPDDTAMLKEVLERRFNHPEWKYPDLIIIDGGKAQLNAALAILRTQELKIPVIALTKDKKHKASHIFISGEKEPKKLKDLSLNLKKLILNVDNEAHRFAIGFHRKLREKSLIPVS